MQKKILTDHWDNFSKMKLKQIAKDMNVSLEVIQEAITYIKENLTPHPTSLYRNPSNDFAPREAATIVPDVIIQKSGDAYSVTVADCYGSALKVDEIYNEMYASIKKGDSYLSSDDCKHIREHVERVKCILDAINLRKKTLAKVAMYLVEYQKQFLDNGPSHLKPLRQKDVAKALNVHESTVCRAVANKYCKLPSGEIVSFDMFFDAALPVRDMIKKLIAMSAVPLSDSEIAKKLSENGINIARRTVAKYREQLKLLPYQLRSI